MAFCLSCKEPEFMSEICNYCQLTSLETMRAPYAYCAVFGFIEEGTIERMRSERWSGDTRAASAASV